MGLHTFQPLQRVLIKIKHKGTLRENLQHKLGKEYQRRGEINLVTKINCNKLQLILSSPHTFYSIVSRRGNNKIY